MLKLIIALIAGYFLGVFGWAQIIGSFQHIKQRGVLMTIVTVSMWIIILGSVYYLTVTKMPEARKGLIIGYVISFIQLATVGEIR